MNRSRRTLLVVVAVIVALCCAGGAGVALWLRSVAVDTRGAVDLVNRLAIPELAASHVDSQGRRVFELDAGAGEHDFGRGAVPTWGFNGSYLGPTLRASRGEEVLVDVHNGLPEPTTVHWHGMHLPAVMDGGPHQMIAPGATWRPQWTIEQPAATLWYHPHPHGATAEHVYRGLAGLFLLDDPDSAGLALPGRYGVDDIPVVVQDKNFAGGQLDFGTSLLGMGILGDTIVVNGTLAPYVEVTTQRVRLRLVNASNARVFQFGFDDGRAFELVGTDGGLLPAPVRTDHVMLSPGERAEIVVTVEPGERTVLRSDPPDLGSPVISRFVGGNDAFDVLQLRAASTLEPSPAVPSRLAPAPDVATGDAVRTRSVRLTDGSINNRHMDMARVDATMAPGDVEVWRVRNADGKPHNLHVHGVSFRVVGVDGGPPPPQLGGWKDTVYISPEHEYELAIRFPRFADPTTAYMYHCHVLYHEDRGMMAQYVVAPPGQVASLHHHH